MTEATHSLLLTLIGALGVGAPALVVSIWRGRKIAPKEENELVARMSQEAVSAGNEMLVAAREERKRMVETIAQQTETITNLEQEKSDLRQRLLACADGTHLPPPVGR